MIPLLEALSEVDDVRKYIPRFVTTDHRVDFQRASHILANAVTVKQQHESLEEIVSVEDINEDVKHLKKNEMVNIQQLT